VTLSRLSTSLTARRRHAFVIQGAGDTSERRRSVWTHAVDDGRNRPRLLSCLSRSGSTGLGGVGCSAGTASEASQLLPSGLARSQCRLRAGGNHAGLQFGNSHHALQEKATRGPLDLREVTEAHIDACFQDPRQEALRSGQAVNLGNHQRGGLFDAQGNLLGITTFMLKGAQNPNFAIAAEEYAK
jgi:hypothetical protein